MDAFALWFSILREHGEILDLQAEQRDSRDAVPRRWEFPHERYDGAGVLDHVLREVRGTSGPRPKIREAHPPSLLDRARAVWRETHEPRRAPVPWKRFDANALGTRPTPTAYELFDRADVRAIEARAQTHGVRLNPFLLWALDRAIYDSLATPSPIHRWGMPVNLYGALGKLDALPNAVSIVGVDVAEGASPAEVKRAIRAPLEQHAHWGAFDTFRILGRLGEKQMRRFADRYYARPGHSWLGTFSSLGPFDVDAGWISFVPPTVRMRPVGASAVSVGGRLSLGLSTHAALGAVDVAALAARWRAIVEGASPA